MSTQKGGASSSQENLPSEIELALEKTNSTVLERRVRRLYAAMANNEKVEQSMSVTWLDDIDCFEIIIDPDDDWSNKGEFGFEWFQIILGPRGGIRVAQKSHVLTGVVHYEEEKHAYKKIENTVGRMC